MELKADFHMHTKDDPLDYKYVRHSAEDLIDHAASLKFQVLSITNHDKITYSPYLKEYAAYRGILLLPGVEATIEGKHVLIINYLGPIGFRSFRDLETIRNPHVLIIGAHPFYPAMTTLQGNLVKHIDLFDAIEHCHFYRPWINFNRKAIALSQRTGKPMFGTSDAHFLAQMNHTYSMVDTPFATPEGVIAAIKKGRVRVVTQPAPYSVMYRVFKMFMFGIFK
ncbi:MAG: PHP domain-containing protein [Deltaproteobacteria bacterium]|nr:PHP domain-containing protein [Deltaproteobacteria bacterium]